MDDLLVSVLGERLFAMQQMLRAMHGELEAETILKATKKIPYRLHWKFTSGEERIVGFERMVRDDGKVVLVPFDNPAPVKAGK